VHREFVGCKLALASPAVAKGVDESQQFVQKLVSISKVVPGASVKSRTKDATPHLAD
jgi:hypothetical protein